MEYRGRIVIALYQKGSRGKAKRSKIKNINYSECNRWTKDKNTALIVCPKSILALSSYQVNISSS
jgi:hypothetical protein